MSASYRVLFEAGTLITIDSVLTAVRLPSISTLELELETNEKFPILISSTYPGFTVLKEGMAKRVGVAVVEVARGVVMFEQCIGSLTI